MTARLLYVASYRLAGYKLNLFINKPVVIRESGINLSLVLIRRGVPDLFSRG